MISLLEAKLGSIIVHLAEYIDGGNSLDITAAMSVIEDEEVKDFFKKAGAIAMLPVPRSSNIDGLCGRIFK